MLVAMIRIAQSQETFAQRSAKNEHFAQLGVFLKALKKNKMDWSNVHFDEKFASDFGGYKALPALFLINDKGVIVYNRQSSQEVDHVKLTTLNEILEKELEK